MNTIAKWRLLGKRTSVAAAAAAMAALAVVQGAAAAEPVILPAGKACSFGVRMDITDPSRRVDRVFTGRQRKQGQGNFGGSRRVADVHEPRHRGDSRLALQRPVEHKVFNPDGSQTVTDTGHNVLILFPTDTPAGPSTTLIVGRVVFTIDPAGNFTLLSTSGRTTDLCAALS